MHDAERHGIGIIGYGGFGAFLHKAWDAMDNARVVAVCDDDPTRHPGGVSFYTSFEEMLGESAVEIVSIATPPSSHRVLAIQAFEAGKHALIEKPLALTPGEAEEIRLRAEELGLVANVNFVLRHNPVVAALRELTAAGVLGKLRRMDLRNYAMQETVPEGHWFWNPDVSGGILLEHGVHFFDLAAFVSGCKARDISALGIERKPGMEDRVFAAVTYQDGLVGTFWHSFSRPRELETTTFHFAYDLGEIDVIGWIPLEMRVWGWTDAGGLSTLDRLGFVLDTVETPYSTAKSSEYDYPVEHEIRGSYTWRFPKPQAYAESLRSIMADLIARIEDPSHQMLVMLEDGVEAVRTAYDATKSARRAGHAP